MICVFFFQAFDKARQCSILSCCQCPLLMYMLPLSLSLIARMEDPTRTDPSQPTLFFEFVDDRIHTLFNLLLSATLGPARRLRCLPNTYHCTRTCCFRAFPCTNRQLTARSQPGPLSFSCLFSLSPSLPPSLPPSLSVFLSGPQRWQAAMRSALSWPLRCYWLRCAARAARWPRWPRSSEAQSPTSSSSLSTTVRRRMGTNGEEKEDGVAGGE